MARRVFSGDLQTSAVGVSRKILTHLVNQGLVSLDVAREVIRACRL
jgi:hypothetical protein